MIRAFPLEWPGGWKRTAPADRQYGRFGVKRSTTPGGYAQKQSVSVAEGVERLLAELRSLGVDREDIVVSTNVQVKLDGLPYSNRGEPVDPGAAVYWRLDGEDQCLAIDLYTRVADNLAALAATIDAMRAIERHGGAAIMKRAFIGLKQLGAGSSVTMTATAAAEYLAGLLKEVPDADMPAQLLASPQNTRAVIRFARHTAHPDRNNGAREQWDLVEIAAQVLTAHHGVSL